MKLSEINRHDSSYFEFVDRVTNLFIRELCRMQYPHIDYHRDDTIKSAAFDAVDNLVERLIDADLMAGNQ